jgi:hypothetical protein
VLPQKKEGGKKRICSLNISLNKKDPECKVFDALYCNLIFFLLLPVD